MIVYNSLGTNPQYYQKEYSLYEKSTNTKISGINWTLHYYDEEGNEMPVNADAEENFDPFGLPVLQNGMLVPAAMYVSMKEPVFPVIVATAGDDTLWA
jgi:hypothetical protein